MKTLCAAGFVSIVTVAEYVQLQAINKWNGVLPTTVGGAIPFINIK